MYLKSLEVQGYKSFANKVEFTFDQGITAVVGPNGSGKSNVADAIRWVLGEQSYSNLRGKKTEDMIFAGSEGRARLGMASATLVLDNSDKWLPLDFNEVTVSRRAYRSGENEYYLNGSRVRLRDVGELLAKGGLSRQTYTVIGQGTIDRVLSLHAEERRKLFEEAAGIIFHRQKRMDALKKLENTQSNLLRLNDIVKEIEPRLRRLQKQAERAEEYALIKTHLDGLLRVWYGYRWRQGQIQLKDVSARLHESETLLKTERAQLQTLIEQLDILRTEQTEARASLSLWYSENNRLNRQSETIQRELAVNQERARQYAAQREEILAELEPLNTNLKTRRQQVEQAEADLEGINLELEQARETLKQAQTQLDAHQAQLQAAESQHSAAAQQVRQLAAGITQGQTRLTQLNERRDTLQKEQDNRQVEISRLTEQQQELTKKQAELTTRLSDLDAELLALESQQQQQRDTLSQLNEAAEKIKAKMSTLQQREGALKARQDVLGRLRNDMSGYFAGVRAVLQPEAELSGIIGPISQVVQAPPDLEVALEAALGGRLQDVVVDSFADAEAAIAYLKQERGGRATFLPLDTIRVNSPADVPNIPGVLGLASDLVSVVDERVRPIAEFALNRTVVVDDLPAARKAFAAMHGGYQIVTREGELMRSGGSVTGGKVGGKRGQEGTFLAREREWRELPKQLDKLAREQDTLSGQLADNHDEVNALKKSVQGLVDQQQQKNNQRREIQGVADKAGRALEQLAANIEWQQDLQAKSTAELAQIADRTEQTGQEIAKLEQEHKIAEAEATRLAEAAQSFSAENMRAELSQARAEMSTVQNRQQNQRALLENSRATGDQIAAQIEAKQLRAQSLAAEREALLGQADELQRRSTDFEGQLGEFTGKIQAGEKQLAELESEQVQVQHDEKESAAAGAAA